MAAAAAAAALSNSYSLWLSVPAGSQVGRQLRQEIATQAKAHSAPLFEPHVTLLGGIEGDAESIITKAQELAARIKPLRLNFLDVAQGASFHRCLYLLVAKEPAIMEAAAAARAAYGMQQAQDSDDFMPHCSLLYADLQPGQRAAAQAGAVQRLYGEGSGYGTLLLDSGFTADAVTVWHTPPEDRSLASWRQVAEVKLRGGA